MKYRRRSIICGLLAGLMALISSCRMHHGPQVELIRHVSLNHFPSASAIEYNAGRIYLLGDDATYMLVLDTNYHPVDSVQYISDFVHRLPKSTKPDIESATIITHNDQSFLYALGSLSTPSRMNLFFFPLSQKDSFLKIDYSPFAKTLTGIKELNIEGLAFAKSKLILANRANTTHRNNSLIITPNTFSGPNSEEEPFIIDLFMENKSVVGISGLCYNEENDILFFTASEEDTPSATQDGIISDSYLGWIRNFSGKMEERTIRMDEMIKLSAIDKSFAKQKIESACIEQVKGSEIIIHLVADNDNGSSALFKLRLSF